MFPQQDVSYLQKMIGDVNAQMIMGVLVVFALTSVAFMAATITGKIELYKLVFVFAVAMSFWVAREDYLIHRNAASIKVLQEQIRREGEWERSSSARTAEQLKDELKSRYLMFPLDLLAASAMFWMLYSSGKALSESGDFGFAIVAGIMIVSGVLMTIIMQLLAQIRW